MSTFAIRGIAVLALSALTACQTNPAIDASPEHTPVRIAEINTQLGIEYMKEGQNDVALKKLQKAIDADPHYANAYNVLGLLYNHLGENDKAQASFSKALSLDPKDPGILNNYGQFLCKTGKPVEAQQMFESAAKNPLYQVPQVALTNAGVCAIEEQHDPESGEKFLRQALARDPKMPQALLQMVKVSMAQERYLPARGYLQRYTEVGQHTPQSLWLGVQIERKLGDKDAAASYALTLRGKFPDSEETKLLEQSGEQ